MVESEEFYNKIAKHCNQNEEEFDMDLNLDVSDDALAVGTENLETFEEEPENIGGWEISNENGIDQLYYGDETYSIKIEHSPNAEQITITASNSVKTFMTSEKSMADVVSYLDLMGLPVPPAETVNAFKEATMIAENLEDTQKELCKEAPKTFKCAKDDPEIGRRARKMPKAKVAEPKDPEDK